MYEELVKRLRNYEWERDDDGKCHGCSDEESNYPNCVDCFSKTHLQAADAIEQLEAAVPKWIPVTDRLPEKDGPVLAYYGFDHGSGMGKMFMQVLDYYATDPKPHFQHEGYANLIVTHWMPLPEPPKEE